MDVRSSSRRAKVLAAVTGAGLLAGAAAVVGVGGPGVSPAAAAPVSITLDYDCVFPLIGSQPLKVVISSDFPSTIPVGQATGEIPIATVSTVSANATAGLRAVGATTLEGTANASSVLTTPTLELPVQTVATIEPTPIPASGTFDVDATGATPDLTFDTPGTYTVNVNDILLDLAPKNAQGALTGLGEFESQCTQRPGQDNELASFQVTGTGGSTTTSTTDPDPTDTEAPSVPGGLRATGTTDTSATLAWTASTDNVAVTGYDVFDGVDKVASSTTPGATVSGLTADTSYTFTVKAKDAAGNTSAASAPVTVRTQPPASSVIPIAFDITGTSTIGSANGTVPLSGGIDAEFDLATGEFTADLTLEPTTGNFNVLWLLPVTSEVEFVQTAETTGTFVDGVLESSSTMDIKLPNLTLGGWLPLGGGPDCKTVSPSVIDLSSGDTPFDPLAGGTLTGTYTLSAVSGCGFLNDWISPFVAGPDNTVEITLTPRA